MWSGPRIISEGQYIVRNSGIGLIHSSNLTITDLEIEDEGEYVCTVRVSGGRNLFGITVDEVIPITVFGKRWSVLLVYKLFIQSVSNMFT